MDAALYQALHMVSGASARWAETVETRPDDDALRARIAMEFGIHHGASGDPGYSAFGGSLPAIYLGDWSHIRKGESLSGQALLDRTRLLLGIPRPSNEPEQQALFTEEQA